MEAIVAETSLGVKPLFTHDFWPFSAIVFDISVNKKPKSEEKVVGTLSLSTKGVGYLRRTEQNLPDIEIENEHLNTALNGDEVEIILLPKTASPFPTRPGKPVLPKGKVVKIISRSKNSFVGTVEISNGTFVVPDDRKMYKDIFVSPENSMGAKTDDKVHVELKPWTDPKKNPEGKIVRIIGRKGDHNTEMEAIVLESGFENNFPKEVLEEAEAVAAHERARMEEETSLRADLRDITTFTIDPFDAKDFDDAISVKKLSDGTYEIGVHIADVSHYVRPGSALDVEARKRGLSVYLVDRTIPMLPEVLSNDLCSLNERVDRLAFSAIFTMNEKGHITKRWFGKSTINSNKRFTYEEAQDVINKKSGPFAEELLTLNKIAHELRKEKFNNGAIDFETTEVKFKLDDKGVPIAVYKKERLDTHKLVEDFMLLANREVAEFIYKSHKTKQGASLYRIHDLPDPQKITDLAIFLKALGFDLKNTDGKITSKEINELLKKVDNTPQESLIKTAAIRSMAKAIYSTKNVGHFGLAFKFYTHFTSPIRRYPDLIVHRVLEIELKGKPVPKDEFSRLERIAIESSDREISAAEAERASIKYKQVEYMSSRIGQTFEGTIAGVAEWGIYIEEKETSCEGMVKLRDLGNDFYVLDKKSYAIVGEKTKQKYSLGDKVKFKVVAADLERRALDYVLV